MAQSTALLRLSPVRVALARHSSPTPFTSGKSENLRLPTFSRQFHRPALPPVRSSSKLSPALSHSKRYTHTDSQLPPRPRASKLPWILFAALASGGVAYATLGGSLSPEKKEKLSFRHFVPLKLLSVERLTKETSLFRLEVPPELLPEIGEVSQGPIKSVYLVQPELQIQRPYTPLSSASFDPDGPGVLELVIKRYEDGELSRWMHRLSPGDEVRVRGPAITWEPPKTDLDEVVFIVGGTGLTPAYQYLQHVLSKPSPTTPKITILYSSPDATSIFLQSSLDSMASKAPEKVSIHYLVDRSMKERGWFDWSKDEGSGTAVDPSVGRVSKEVVEKTVGPSQKDKKTAVIVCGPEGMIEVIAGPRGRNQSQGPIGGVLGELGYTSSQVVKL